MKWRIGKQEAFVMDNVYVKNIKDAFFFYWENWMVFQQEKPCPRYEKRDKFKGIKCEV